MTAPMAAGVSLVMLVVEIGLVHAINLLQRSQLLLLWLPLDVVPLKKSHGELKVSQSITKYQGRLMKYHKVSKSHEVPQSLMGLIKNHKSHETFQYTFFLLDCTVPWFVTSSEYPNTGTP